MGHFSALKIQGVVRPFLEPLRLAGRGGFPLSPSPRPSPPKLLTWLGKNNTLYVLNQQKLQVFNNQQERMNKTMNIGIDHGYYAIKTRHFSFPAGISEYSHEPYTLQNTLEYLCAAFRRIR